VTEEPHLLAGIAHVPTVAAGRRRVQPNGIWVLMRWWALGSVPRRERHLWSKDLPAWPVLTLNSGSSVWVYPRGPSHRLRVWLFSRKEIVQHRPSNSRQSRHSRLPRLLHPTAGRMAPFHPRPSRLGIASPTRPLLARVCLLAECLETPFRKTAGIARWNVLLTVTLSLWMR
jgi:hypothetical protein